MAQKRMLIYSLFLLALPIAVAYWEISTAGAIFLVLLALLARLAITQSVLMSPPRVPELELETIAISHYSEKVRWCMDRLGLDYVEHTSAGILGVFFTGRTVPQLKIHTGLTRSVIGNSPQILRYLWGAYGSVLGERAAFLEPTPKRLELEERIDDYARDLQIWAYYYLLDDRELTLQAWGRHSPTVALWQRWLLVLLFPVLRAFMRRAFQLSQSRVAMAVQRSESLLGDIETGLADGRRSLLGGDEIDFVDIALAAVASAWLQPSAFAAGKAESVRLPRDRVPRRMAEDIARWTQSFPRTVAFVERLYHEERKPSGPLATDRAPADRTATARRRFSLPSERVFDAFLDPQYAQQFFFATREGRIVRCEIDARVGGRFVVTDRRQEGDVEHVGKYLELDRPRRLVFAFGIPAQSKDETVAVLDFKPVDGGCEVLLGSELPPDWADYVNQASESWREILDRLAEVLEPAARKAPA